MKTYVDRNGRPAMEGDLVKVFHFKASNGRNCFMYKKLFRALDNGQVAESGEHLTAVDVQELGTKLLPYCHQCRLDWCGPFEIIEGPVVKNPDRSITCWWERKKVKPVTHPAPQEKDA